MTETYRQAISAAKERWKEAMDSSAWDVLAIMDMHDRPLQTVAKDIAGEEWQALRSRAQRLQKSAGKSVDQRARDRAKEKERIYTSHARAVLKDPERAAKVIASLSPAALDEVYQEARLARAGEDRSPAHRKAASAAASHAVEPLKRVVATTHAALGIQALREARDDLKAAIEDDALTASQISKADALCNEIANLLMEARFAEGVEA